MISNKYNFLLEIARLRSEKVQNEKEFVVNSYFCILKLFIKARSI